MKWSLLVFIVVSWSLGAMEFGINKDKKEGSGDEFIQLGEVEKDYQKPRRSKQLLIHKDNNQLDIELEDMEQHGNYYDSHRFNKSKYFQKLLQDLPIFEGKKVENINNRMEQIKNMLPEEYEKITEILSDSYRGFKKRVRNNRGISSIDQREVIDINARIQYALLEIADENQKISAKNREEDLGQAAKDRKCTIITSVVGFTLSVPALTLAIINIVKAFK